MTEESEPWPEAVDPWVAPEPNPWGESELGSTGESAEVSWPVIRSVDDQIVWHYTTTVGLFGILSSGRLWSSSAAMLNDTTEMTHGLDLLAEVRWNRPLYLDSRQESFLEEVLTETRNTILGNDVMVACASTEGDDLAQWRAYAAGSGYAVGLRPVRLTPVDLSGRKPVIYRGIVSGTPTGWGRVEYDTDAKIDLLERALLYAVSMLPEPSATPEEMLLRRWAGVGTLTAVIPHLKHDGFASEREVRLVHLLGGMDTGAVKIRTSPFGLTPYIDLALALDRTDTDFALTTAQPGKLPIERIMVGPGPHQEAAARGLESSLPVLGYPNVAVDVSGVPFR